MESELIALTFIHVFKRNNFDLGSTFQEGISLIKFGSA